MTLGTPIVGTESSASELKLDERTYARGLACVHCGLCLPACPTYNLTNNEAESPRGRIHLMLALSDGRVSLTRQSRHALETCLDCRACETACPSSVVFHEMIEETRARIAGHSTRPMPKDRLIRWFIFNVLPSPGRLGALVAPMRLLTAAGLLRMARRLHIDRLIPNRYRGLFNMVPNTLPMRTAQTPRRLRAQGRPKLRVALFPGCVGQVLQPELNRKTMELLAHAGADVSLIGTDRCCGAIHHHNGRSNNARTFARRVIHDTVRRGMPDRIALNIAGCGAMLREYGELLRHDATYASTAADFSSRVRDVTEVLVELGFQPPARPRTMNLRATLHEPCHLVHAQKVRSAPRQLLKSLPGLTLVEMHEPDTCCGAAGTYSLHYPETAAALAKRKLLNIRQTHCGTCISGNVGCSLHLAAHARSAGLETRFLHPIELLHESVFGGRA